MIDTAEVGSAYSLSHGSRDGADDACFGSDGLDGKSILWVGK
jgi:hypothetical protein